MIASERIEDAIINNINKTAFEPQSADLSVGKESLE